MDPRTIGERIRTNCFTSPFSLFKKWGGEGAMKPPRPPLAPPRVACLDRVLSQSIRKYLYNKQKRVSLGRNLLKMLTVKTQNYILD